MHRTSSDDIQGFFMIRRFRRPALLLLASFGFIAWIASAHTDRGNDSPASACAAKAENFLGLLHLDTGPSPVSSAKTKLRLVPG
jgi:hypothetical protein